MQPVTFRQHHITFQRVCTVLGLVSIGMFFGGFFFADFLPVILKPHASAAAVAAHYREHTTGIRIGGLLIMASAAPYIALTAVISHQMRRIADVSPVAVQAQLAAGALASVTMMMSGLMLSVAAFRPDQDPEMLRTLNDFFWIVMILPWPPFMVQNYVFAYAILVDPRPRPLFPRWLGYFNIWLPLLYVPDLMPTFFKTGPFSWAGLFAFWMAGTAFLSWFLVNCTMLLRAIKQEEAEGRASASQVSAAPRVAAGARSTAAGELS